MDEIVVDQATDRASIAAVRERAQAELVEAISDAGIPVVAVALRGPWDVAVYPPAITALATYSILPGSLDALAAVLAGDAVAPGRLPVAIGR